MTGFHQRKIPLYFTLCFSYCHSIGRADFAPSSSAVDFSRNEDSLKASLFAHEPHDSDERVRSPRGKKGCPAPCDHLMQMNNDKRSNCCIQFTDRKRSNTFKWSCTTDWKIKSSEDRLSAANEKNKRKEKAWREIKNQHADHSLSNWHKHVFSVWKL